MKHVSLSAFVLATAMTAPAAFADDQMGNMPMPASGKSQPMPAVAAQGFGVVKQVDVANKMIVLAHEEIKALKWPAMTMGFQVANAALLKGIKAGQQVMFTLKGSEKAGYLVSSLSVKP